jgi:hypothetical protein
MIHTQTVLVVSPECEEFEAEWKPSDDRTKVIVQLTCNSRYETICRQFLQNSEFLRGVRRLRDLVESVPVENATGEEEMKRYLLFFTTDYQATDDYQATEQGWDGFCDNFDSIPDAVAYVKNMIIKTRCTHYQIVDTNVLKVVERGRIALIR